MDHTEGRGEQGTVGVTLLPPFLRVIRFPGRMLSDLPRPILQRVCLLRLVSDAGPGGSE